VKEKIEESIFFSVVEITNKKDQNLHYLKEYVHFSCTSEDINNLSYALMMNDANQNVVCPNINKVIDKIDTLAKEV